MEEEMIPARRRKPWLVPVIVAAVLLVAAAFVWWQNEFTLDLTLEGPREITLEVGSAFEDPGALACFSGSLLMWKERPVPVELEGSVDTARLGSYSVNYRARKELNYGIGKLFFEKTEARTVHVVDTTPPVITLHTNPEAFTLPGQAYVEEGFTVTDNYDLDVADRLARWVEEDGVHYKVSDASGNVTEVVRPIVYNDPIAPELTLLGKETTIVVQGNKYQEPGFTAVDNGDGDMTEAVTVSGQVDHLTLGEYALTYTVTDSFGNSASATRTVIVREYPELPDFMPMAEPYTIVQPEGKVIYLTFDDGPSPFTDQLLDVLAKYDAKATFFVVDRGYKDTLRRIADEGHTLAMHCGTHTYREIYVSEEAYFNDLKRIQDVILEETGQLATIVRFPGGTGNTVSCGINSGIMTRLSKMLHAMNYRYFDWNVSSGDAGETNDPTEIYHNVIGGITGKQVAIVLQHDINPNSVQAVENILKWGIKNGYTFLGLDTSSPACEVKPRN